MANQSNSRADDLMVGAGTLFFKRSDDPHGLHHLGNVEEFNITTDVTTVEKNSAMNKGRALMASVVTAVNPTGTLTMNEYNPYNLALGLYGREGVRTQAGGAFTGVAYTVPSVPGVIELIDPVTNERYVNVTGVTVGLSSATSATFSFGGAINGYTLDPSATIPDTVLVADSFGTDGGGGTITLNLNGTTSTTAQTIYVQVEGSPTTPGDLAGMRINLSGGDFSSGDPVHIAPAGTSWTIPVGSTGMDITFDVGTNTTTNTDPAFPGVDTPGISGYYAIINFTPSTSSGVPNQDYIADEHLLRGGIIQIPSGSSFTAGQQVFINFTVPEEKLVTVSGADAGEIEGQLLFIGDPNIGGRYNIEGWKVKVQPEGDLTGLIGEDFGSFQLTMRFLSDKQNHPDCEYFRATICSRADGANSKAGEYDPEY